MAQRGIPMLNKVGNSMFWNSMWDSKINYTRFLKEDIFLSKFIDLFLSDNISINTLNTNILTKVLISKYQISSNNLNIMKKKRIFLNKNKQNIFTSKLWLLRYQGWIILYCFFYSPKHNQLKKIKYFWKKKSIYNYNIYNIYNIFLKSNSNFNKYFSYFKSQNYKNIF